MAGAQVKRVRPRAVDACSEQDGLRVIGVDHSHQNVF
jgi:hypothetical protein